MTVGQKLHMTLASLESAKANLDQFGLDTQNKATQAEYFEIAAELGTVVERFRNRVNTAEAEEPQYKVKQQAMDSQNQQQS